MSGYIETNLAFACFVDGLHTAFPRRSFALHSAFAGDVQRGFPWTSHKCSVGLHKGLLCGSARVW